MKKNLLLLLSAAFFIVGCGSNSNKESSNNDSSSFEIFLNSDSFNPSSSTSLVSSLEPSSSAHSSISSSKNNSSSEIDYGEPVIDGETAQELIVYAGPVDILKAKTSVDMLLADGYDNGNRYNQTQTINYTSYSNDVTIGEGSLSHTTQGKTYQDTFDHVKLLKDYTYIDARQYHAHIFNDDTQKYNILTSSDPSAAYADAMKQLSCGAGYLAFSDFYYIAIELGCDISYDAFYEEDSRLHIIFYAEFESKDTNQLFLAQYDYYFDSVEGGFLTEYHAEQAFYSYDIYMALEDPSELEPTYYGLEILYVESGTKTPFTGVLPIDVDSTFVKSITLTAAMTTIEIEEKVALRAEVLPKSASDKSLKFVSSNESVARVDYTGRVTGISEGTCTIYALNYASGVEGHIEITVVAKRPLDSGDDALKGDLREALNLAKDQYIPVDAIFHETIVGMVIDEDLPLDGEALSQLSISDFAFDEVTRTAIYVGDLKNLESIIPFKDNGIEALSNTYYFERTSHVYKDNILGMEIELTAQNEIGVVNFKMRTDSFTKPQGLNIQTLTNENVLTILTDYSAGYVRNVYYESEGFYSDAEEEIDYE